MFLLIDSAPYAQAEPCNVCKTLIEVGPPPMADAAAGHDVVKPSAPCRHHRPTTMLSHLVDFHFDKNCA